VIKKRRKEEKTEIFTVEEEGPETTVTTEEITVPKENPKKKMP